MPTTTIEDALSDFGPVITPPQLGEFLRVPVATLHQWHSRGRGPVAFRAGRHLRYMKADVAAWLSESRGVPAA